MAGCGCEVEYYSPMKNQCYPRKCGTTGESGYPILCDPCEDANAGRNWRREALESGENFDEDY